MLHKILLSIPLLVFSIMLRADTVQVDPDHPDEYVVQKGDTLWDISSRFLTEPWRWPEIWQANPQIENPHLIYPGDVVRLTYEGDSPVLTVDRGGMRRTGGRTVRLSPEIRYIDQKDAIPTIPIEAIREFLTRPLVVSENEINSWAYIVSSYDQHLINGKGNEIYVRGLPEDTNQRTYSIYRKGPAYESNGEHLGYEAIYVGEAFVQAFGDPATAIITSSEREALNGDRLIPRSETDINSDIIPSSPDRDVSGNIISAIDVLSEIGQYQVVVLDLGKTDGMQVGNVLGVYQQGDVITDRIVKEGDHQPVAGYGTNPLSNLVGDTIKTKQDFDNTALVGYLGRPAAAGEKVRLPDKYAGVILVFRTFNRVSYALVMEAEGPMHLQDKVTNL